MALSDGHYEGEAVHPDRGELMLRLRDVKFNYVMRVAKRKKMSVGETASGALGGVMKRIGKRKLAVSAIDGISLDVHAGERIGILGGNGAGKSTLLRVMAGILPPESGTVEVYGKVAAIFGQMHGMDAELTGYENIKVRGLFLNLPNELINEKTAEIAEFSELGPYLHLPLRTYSAGMRMRLGFAASTCFDTDILLLDEWLSVGDKSFTKKARARMAEFYERAATVVLVSHNRKLLEDNCEAILTMDHGKIIGREVVAKDEAYSDDEDSEDAPAAEKPTDEPQPSNISK